MYFILLSLTKVSLHKQMFKQLMHFLQPWCATRFSWLVPPLRQHPTTCWFLHLPAAKNERSHLGMNAELQCDMLQAASSVYDCQTMTSNKFTFIVCQQQYNSDLGSKCVNQHWSTVHAKFLSAEISLWRTWAAPPARSPGEAPKVPFYEHSVCLSFLHPSLTSENRRWKSAFLCFVIR